MKIVGFLPESFQDWDAGLSSVIFTGKCNFKCPGCYAGKLVRGEKVYDSEEIVKRLKRKSKHISRVVICGGEPTLELDLKYFLKDLKAEGFKIKLDTNGSNFPVLQEILEDKLVDYAAMDVKASPELYSQVVGRQLDMRDDVEKGIGLVCQFPEHEFRTTLFPLYGGGIRWMTPREVGDIAKFIYETVGNNGSKYFLQRFTARSKEEMLDERFSKENLPAEYQETPRKLVEEMLVEARKYLPKAEIRN